MKFEGNSNAARKLRYERKLAQEEALAEKALRCDYDLPGHYRRSTDEPRRGAVRPLRGAAIVCLVSIFFWAVVVGAIWIIWGTLP